MIVAVIPAAGRSERMGRPKLILPVQGVSLIARVISNLRGGGVGRVVVVTPPADEPGAAMLIGLSRGQGAEVVVPSDRPLDMRASIELGIEHLSSSPEPTTLLLAPGDSPGIRAWQVARLIQAAIEQPGRIVVPCHQGRRGHPVVFPWSLARRIPELPVGVGVNAMLTEHSELVFRLDLEDPSILDDLDTPEDYEKWARTGL